MVVFLVLHVINKFCKLYVQTDLLILHKNFIEIILANSWKDIAMKLNSKTRLILCVDMPYLQAQLNIMVGR